MTKETLFRLSGISATFSEVANVRVALLPTFQPCVSVVNYVILLLEATRVGCFQMCVLSFIKHKYHTSTSQMFTVIAYSTNCLNGGEGSDGLHRWHI